MRESAKVALRSLTRAVIRAAIVAILIVAPLGTGCSSQPQAPHGSPVLVGVWWVVNGNRTQVWGADLDASVSEPIPPGASEVDFVFDRRLDGSRIEDTSGNTTTPKPNPPITVGWPDAATVMSDPPFSDAVFYNSIALYGGESSYVFLRPHVVGFPSSTPITFSLDANNLTSAYGEPMNGPATITMTTDALAVVPGSSPATDASTGFPPSFKLPVQFTARPAVAAALVPFVHARADGQELPVAMAADPVDPTVVYVGPTCAAGWPVGANVEVTFDAGLPDAFGVATASPLVAGSFRINGSTDAGSEAACGGG